VFIDELRLPEPDYALDVGSASHAVQTARIMERLEPILIDERPDVVLVPGDVNSTLAAALAAAKLALPIAHVESGLRSFDRTMPEEINRVLTDQVSEYLFVHSHDAVSNLEREGVESSRVHFVGNTMIDSLVEFEARFRSLDVAGRLGLTAGSYLLVTLHRPNLVDGPLLREALDRLVAVSRQLPVIFPLHPRTRRMMPPVESASGLRLVDPLGYLEFLSLEAEAAAILTDSGGVQEEATFLGVPCFTLRDSTERPVTIELGTNTLLGLEPSRIDDIVPALASALPYRSGPPPLWDGHASKRIAKVLVP